MLKVFLIPYCSFCRSHNYQNCAHTIPKFTGVVRKLWRNPHHDAAFSTLEKIADALGVSVKDLIEDEDEGFPPS